MIYMTGWVTVNKEKLKDDKTEEKLIPPGALSLASPGVPGNCRQQCSVPGRSP